MNTENLINKVDTIKLALKDLSARELEEVVSACVTRKTELKNNERKKRWEEIVKAILAYIEDFEDIDAISRNGDSVHIGKFAGFNIPGVIEGD